MTNPDLKNLRPHLAELVPAAPKASRKPTRDDVHILVLSSLPGGIDANYAESYCAATAARLVSDGFMAFDGIRSRYVMTAAGREWVKLSSWRT